MEVGDALSLSGREVRSTRELEQIGKCRAIAPEGAHPGREVGSLVHQRRDRHRPPAADLAEDVVGRHFGAVEEDLVKGRPAVHLPDRTDLEAALRLLHRERETGYPVLPLGRRIGAGEQDAVVGFPRVAGPDLLPEDLPSAVFEHGPGGEGGEVAARVRLAEELAPDLLAAEDLGEEALLLSGAAVSDDRWARPAGPDDGDRARRAGAGQLQRDQVVLKWPCPAAAVLGRPGRRSPAALGQPALPFPTREGSGR